MRVGAYNVLAVLVVAFVLVFGLGMDPIGRFLPAERGQQRTIQVATATVVRVVDGDTIDVRIGTTTQSVRMIGIDAPEITWPDEVNGLQQPQSACFGLQARQFLQDKLADRTVRLVGDLSQPAVDTYDRRLAYVYVDGELINKTLLARGFARELSVGDGYSKQATFRRAVARAKANDRGIWKESCEPEG